MEGEPSAGIDALLAHRAWVRDLARLLVADGAAAEDLEQQAWLEAMTRPPRHGGALRAWFGRVLRRRASDARRERWRRTRREEAAARPEAVRGTAEVVAEAEAHRRVVDAVLSLEEPYRETVLLRFFEDLPPREVAARQSVPVETVRTRTRRALERLRVRLDGGSGGERGAWVAALLPIAGARWGTAAATGGAGMAVVAVLGGLVGGLSVHLTERARSRAQIVPALVEMQSLRERIESLEARSAAPRGAPAPDGERVAALQRRVEALEAGSVAGRSRGPDAGAADASPPTPPVEETPARREEREAARRKSLDALEKGKKSLVELEAKIDEVRRQFLDRSLLEGDRIAALMRLRFLPGGIDATVIQGVVGLFRETAHPTTKDALLREVHNTSSPDLKALFLEALRSDSDERVRERAARDIDTYLDDPAVVQALEAARDGDASAKVRASAAKTLEAKKPL